MGWGLKAATGRAARGGSWINNDHNLRAALRNSNNPDNRNDNRGFRVVMAAESRSAAEIRHANAARSRTGGWRRNMTRPPPAGPLEK
jgi:hypothetical protein